MTTNKSGAISDGSVLFWAETDPAALWRGAAVLLLMMAPLAFFAPAGFIAATAASLLLRTLNQRSFRFEVSGRELRLKLNVLLPTMRVPLSDIASVNVLPDTADGFMKLAPRTGHLVIARNDGMQILVPGVKDAAEAAQAIITLKRQGEASETGGEFKDAA